MIDPLALAAFAPASLALNMTPGVDMMFCFGQGLRGGPRAAWAASAGVAAGAMVNVTLAGLGLGALITAAPHAFDTIRWAGVAYLLWLALRALTQPIAAPDAPPPRAARAFRDAMFVNLTNPKVILFILAFIPQFVDPARGSVLLQFLLFGGILSLGGLLINGAVGMAAGGIGGRLARSPRLARGLGFASAGIFFALAARLAFLERA